MLTTWLSARLKVWEPWKSMLWFSVHDLKSNGVSSCLKDGKLGELGNIRGRIHHSSTSCFTGSPVHWMMPTHNWGQMSPFQSQTQTSANSSNTSVKPNLSTQWGFPSRSTGSSDSGPTWSSERKDSPSMIRRQFFTSTCPFIFPSINSSFLPCRQQSLGP